MIVNWYNDIHVHIRIVDCLKCVFIHCFSCIYVVWYYGFFKKCILNTCVGTIYCSEWFCTKTIQNGRCISKIMLTSTHLRQWTYDNVNCLYTCSKYNHEQATHCILRLVVRFYHYTVCCRSFNRRPCCYNFLFVDYLDNKMLSSVNHAKLWQVFALVCPFYEENELLFFFLTVKVISLFNLQFFHHLIFRWQGKERSFTLFIVIILQCFHQDHFW